jgi:hypothetical protein
MIEFECPSCSHPIKVASELAGRKGKCSKCGNRMIIPGDLKRDGANDKFFESLAVDEAEAPVSSAEPLLFKGPIWSAAKRERPKKKPFPNLRFLVGWYQAFGGILVLIGLGIVLWAGVVASNPNRVADAEKLLWAGIEMIGGAFTYVVFSECILLALSVEENLRIGREKSERNDPPLP